MMVFEYLMAALGLSRKCYAQRGATLIEYVLIVAVIAIAVFTGTSFGLVTAISGLFTSAATAISGG